jgi:hypothetical protein
VAWLRTGGGKVGWRLWLRFEWECRIRKMEEVDRLRGEVNWGFSLQGLMEMAVREVASRWEGRGSGDDFGTDGRRIIYCAKSSEICSGLTLSASD